jgi:hypothetical protein
MPSGLDTATIKIDRPALGPQFDATGILAAIVLEPTGTTFSVPVTLTFTIDHPAVPGVILASGESGELLDPTVTFDPSTGITSVSVQIKHFSYAVAYEHNVKAEIDNPGDHFVGQNFDVHVTITRTAETTYAPLDESLARNDFEKAVTKVWNATTFVEPFGPLNVNPGKFESSGITVTPAEIKPAPDFAMAVEDQPFTFSGRFRCVMAFRDQIKYSGSVSQAVKLHTVFFVSRASDVPVTTYFEVSTPNFKCLDATAAPPTRSPEPTPTPTPTKTPTPKPTPTPTPTPTPQAVKTNPPGVYWISGLCFTFDPGPPPLLVLEMYSYDFPVDSMELTIDGVNNGEPVTIPYDAEAGGFAGELPVTGSGPLTIKSVIFVGPDGTRTDFTELFLYYTDGPTLDTSKDDHWGTICQ